jgi:hypothetical protein
MMLTSPEKQKDHGKDAMLVADLRPNIDDLEASKSRFFVPNDKGNAYRLSRSQAGAHVALPVPVFFPRVGSIGIRESPVLVVGKVNSMFRNSGRIRVMFSTFGEIFFSVWFFRKSK